MTVYSILTPSAFSTAFQYWLPASGLGGVPKGTGMTLMVETSPRGPRTERTKMGGSAGAAGAGCCPGWDTSPPAEPEVQPESSPGTATAAPVMAMERSRVRRDMVD